MAETKNGVKQKIHRLLMNYRTKRYKAETKYISDHMTYELTSAVDNELIDQILAIGELAVVDRGAELPQLNVHSGVMRNPELYLRETQQNMLKAGWVKELKGG